MRRRNTGMKFSVLSSLLLVCLLVMTVQGDSSSSSVVPGYEGDKNKFEVTGITAMSAQKEPFDQRGGAVHMRKLGLGGKKLTTQEETSMDSKNRKGAYEGGTSKISGATYSDDGICEYEREGEKIVKCKGEKSIKQRKLKMADFVAFTDDYHGPRQHLPKHN